MNMDSQELTYQKASAEYVRLEKVAESTGDPEDISRMHKAHEYMVTLWKNLPRERRLIRKGGGK